MTNSATPSPEEKTYRRVLFVAALDGWSVVGIAGIGLLLSLAFGNLRGVLIGLLIATAGLMELHGRRLLVRRDAGGLRWLVRAQMFLLGVILIYCVTSLGSFDAELALGNMTPDMETALLEAGLTRADIAPLVHMFSVILYSAVGVGSLICQGGLTFYYRRAAPRVTAFFAQAQSAYSQLAPS